MMVLLPIFVAISALTSTTFAALSMTDIAGQCADTSGFNTCWSNALGQAETCYQQNCEGQGTCTDENDCTSSDANCVQACSCVAYAQMVQCALISCWNMVRTNFPLPKPMRKSIWLTSSKGNLMRVPKPSHLRITMSHRPWQKQSLRQ